MTGADVMKKQQDQAKRTEAKREFLAWQLGFLKEGIPPAGEPEWVTRLRFQEWRAAMPTLTASTLAEFRTRAEQGAVCGHLRALICFCRANPDWLSSEGERRAIEELSASVNRVVVDAMERMDDNNGAQFFKRLGQAWERGWIQPNTLPVGGRGKSNTLTWAIKRLWIQHWQEVEKLTEDERCWWVLQKLPESLRETHSRAVNREKFAARVKKMWQRRAILSK